MTMAFAHARFHAAAQKNPSCHIRQIFACKAKTPLKPFESVERRGTPTPPPPLPTF